MKPIHLAPLLMLFLTAAMAPLTISKTSAVVSDPQGNVLPKRVPGSLIDYTITVSNPNGIATPVTGVTLSDAIPANTILRVGDLGLLPGSGPVVFTDGVLPASLLTYSFGGLGSTTDRLDFSRDNGATWTYVPSGEFDANVTNIRVRLGGTQVAGSSFTLRFRVKVK